MVSGTQITQGEADVMMGKLDVDDGALRASKFAAPDERSAHDRRDPVRRGHQA